MKNEYKFKRMNHIVCSSVLTVLIGCSMLSSFVPVQAKTIVKKVKSKKEVKRVKGITVNVGKSKIICVKNTGKVKWTTSNKKVVTVKSIGKTKVKIIGNKVGSAIVNGKAGKKSWTFKIAVKGKANKKFNVHIDGIKNNETIVFDTPGEANTYVGILIHSNTPKKIKFSSSDTSVIKTDVAYYAGDPGFSQGSANCDLKPQKAGTATITISYPGGSKSYTVHAKGSKSYNTAEKFVNSVNASGLDDAHKAFVTAKWLEKRMSYGEDDNSDDSLESAIVYGKGVCSDYTRAYEWLLMLEGITSRYISTGETGDHAWNQVCINGKYYNVDVTYNDGGPFDPEYTKYILKSDNYTRDNEVYPFMDKVHSVKYRSGDGKYPVTASATDYDNYDWSSFAQSEQFKELINN